MLCCHFSHCVQQTKFVRRGSSGSASWLPHGQRMSGSSLGADFFLVDFLVAADAAFLSAAVFVGSLPLALGLLTLLLLVVAFF